MLTKVLKNKGWFKKGHSPNRSSFKKGHRHTQETKEKLRQSHLGKKQSEEAKEKNRQSHLNRPLFTKEHKEKIRQSKLGDKNPSKRLEIREKMRQSKLGENHPSWIKDRSFLIYTDDWSDTLRESIRQRDIYICQECGLHRDEIDIKLDVHHIDYNKKNNDPNNLITLCRSCHAKTNYNREYWLKYFIK